MSHQQSFSYVGTGPPGLNKYKARINVSCSRTQRSDASDQLFHEIASGIPFRVSNSLDPDQARHYVGPDLGPI